MAMLFFGQGNSNGILCASVAVNGVNSKLLPRNRSRGGRKFMGMLPEGKSSGGEIHGIQSSYF